MRTGFDTALADRLVRYCAVDTQSDAASQTTPSSAIQLDLAKSLAQELEALGASDVKITEYGAVLARIPGNVATAPTIGFCSHLDTTEQFPGFGVKPRLHSNWDGAPITYPDEPTLVLDPADKPYLADRVGHDIITASGTTLLGADDKSGIAVIMTMADHLLTNPDIPRGTVSIAFTPDEEIGRGVDRNLPQDMNADFAYTLDGDDVGILNYETFSADGAEIKITGVSIHPGDAKDVMVNALHIAAEIVSALNIDGETPETTDDRRGFAMCTKLAGNAAEATINLILRDYELSDLEARGQALRDICARISGNRYPTAKVTCDITKQYRNMRYWLEDDMTPVDLARAAYADVGLEVTSKPIRGGTDGSQLTELGLPCPNIFTGQQEIHGPLEYISVQDMAAAVRVCLALVERAAQTEH